VYILSPNSFPPKKGDFKEEDDKHIRQQLPRRIPCTIPLSAYEKGDVILCFMGSL
jgi:hypothetical protein